MVAQAYIRKVTFLQDAASQSDIRQARSIRLHALHGSQDGRHAITLHDRWRLVISFEGDTIVIEEVTNHYGD